MHTPQDLDEIASCSIQGSVSAWLQKLVMLSLNAVAGEKESHILYVGEGQYQQGQVSVRHMLGTHLKHKLSQQGSLQICQRER